MTNITPKSHVYRLGIVLAICIFGFLAIKSYAIPASWNHHAWYRSNNQEDLKQLPLSYGGNESCKSCHKDVNLVGNVASKGKAETVDEIGTQVDNKSDTQPKPKEGHKHKTLSCESCHGPLAKHVKGEDKIGDAVVMNKSNWQCLNCHEKLVSRPAGFPQFTDKVEKHRELGESTLCMKCHDPHDPIEQAGADGDKEVNEFGGDASI